MWMWWVIKKLLGPNPPYSLLPLGQLHGGLNVTEVTVMGSDEIEKYQTTTISNMYKKQTKHTYNSLDTLFTIIFVFLFYTNFIYKPTINCHGLNTEMCTNLHQIVKVSIWNHAMIYMLSRVQHHLCLFRCKLFIHLSELLILQYKHIIRLEFMKLLYTKWFHTYN